MMTKSADTTGSFRRDHDRAVEGHLPTLIWKPTPPDTVNPRIEICMGAGRFNRFHDTILVPRIKVEPRRLQGGEGK